MGKLTQLTGIKNVMGKWKFLNGTKIGPGIGKGLKSGGLFLQRESMKIVPVDQNILRLTARTRNIGGLGFDTDIIVEYRKDYAVYVH